MAFTAMLLCVSFSLPSVNCFGWLSPPYTLRIFGTAMCQAFWVAFTAFLLYTLSPLGVKSFWSLSPHYTLCILVTAWCQVLKFWWLSPLLLCVSLSPPGDKRLDLVASALVLCVSFSPPGVNRLIFGGFHPFYFVYSCHRLVSSVKVFVAFTPCTWCIFVTAWC